MDQSVLLDLVTALRDTEVHGRGRVATEHWHHKLIGAVVLRVTAAGDLAPN